MDQPLVSIICLCYNQAAFVAAAIDSVLTQSYPHIELIIVDDASSDESQKIIVDKVKKIQLPVKTILNKVNQGNCLAFNNGLAHAHGKYVIDLAADDILLEERVAEGVQVLESLTEDFGVHYCDVIEIDRYGTTVPGQKPQFKPRLLEGDLYASLITNYWINPASMLIKKTVLDQLSGYDESLTYEDFDFWIRSARDFQYAYSPRALVKKRVLTDSLGSQQKQFRNKHEYSTYRVCYKIKELNRSNREHFALRRRVLYEMSRCARLGHFGLVFRYLKLLIT